MSANTSYLLNVLVCFILALIVVSFIVDYKQSCKKKEKTYIFDAFSNKLVSIQVGDTSYRVQEDLENPHSAAELMDRISGIAKSIIDHMKKKYIIDSNGMKNVRPEYQYKVNTGIKNLEKNFNPKNLIENLPDHFDKDTSYVVDKGEVFAICLRDVHNNNSLTIDMNEMVFVVVHELSHLFTISYGHEFEFWANFRFLLNEVVQMGLHIPINYKMQKKPYCGNHITYSPLYDNGLPDYLFEGNFPRST